MQSQLTSFSKKNLSLFIFMFVSFLFSYKYLSRVMPYSILISFGIISLYLLLWKKRDVLFLNENFSKKLILLSLLIFALFSFFIFKKIPVETLNVDRWSVITSFWDSYFRGDYVYFAKSNVGNYPGPMPFYFIFALPFYLMGELGWFSVLGVVLFYFIIKRNVTDQSLKFISVSLILINVPYLWEVTCRSNIFLNASLVLWVLIYFANQQKTSSKNSIITGILIGLILSTRNVFVIPFIIAFIYYLKAKEITVKQILLIGTVALLSFSLTFVPFVWNHFSEFKAMNPFIIQSSFLMPFKYTLLFIVASFTAGLYCKSINDIYFYSGLVLWGTISFYFIYWIFRIGYEETFVNSYADISYFILCLPFVLFHLLKESDTYT